MQMLEFNNLHIEGYKSIGTFDINLNQKGITLIKGVNGVGKTTFLEAIGWVLFGVTQKGVSDVSTWKRYRTKEYKGTLVSIYYRSKGCLYKVTRCYNYTGEVDGAIGKNQLFFWEDGILYNEKKKTLIQEKIQDTLGLSYNLFINSIMFGQGLKRIIQESNTDQKKLFDEIFDMKFIQDARELAKEELTKRQEYFNDLEKSLKNFKSTLEVIQNSLKNVTEAEKVFKKNQREKLKELRENKTLSTKALKELELKAPKQISEAEIKELKQQLKVAKDRLTKVQEKNRGLSIEDMIDVIIEKLKNKEYDQILSELQTLKQSFTSLEIHKATINDLNQAITDKSNGVYKYNLWKQKIENIKDKIAGIERQIKVVKNVQPQSTSPDLKLKEEQYKKNIQETSEKLKEAVTELDNYKWVYNEPLGNNGLKAYIFENSLGELNEILEEYSKVVGIGIWFLMDTSSARKEFTTYIKMDGETVLYEELSGGQKQMVNLIMAFAMNELISYSKGVNITFLDEVFENLSSDNIELVISIVRKIFKEKTLFLITHHDSLPLGNSRTIEVTKENGLTKYTF